MIRIKRALIHKAVIDASREEFCKDRHEPDHGDCQTVADDESLSYFRYVLRATIKPMVVQNSKFQSFFSVNSVFTIVCFFI